MSGPEHTRIVLTSVTGCRNRGVEALAASALEQFRRVAPDAEFTVLSSDVEYDGWLLGDRATVIPDAARFFGGGRLLQLRAKATARAARVPARVAPRYREAVEAFRRSDLVVATGGDVFSSDYGASLPRRSLAMLEAAQDAGARTVFLSQSIGPFKTAAELEAWAAVAQRAALVTVREQASYDYVTGEAGIPAERVRLTADPAFLLPLAGAERIDGLWRAFGLARDVPTVAIAPSKGIGKFAGVDAAAHLRRWAEVVARLADGLGVQVLVIPHVHTTNPSNDDRIVATELIEACGYRPELRVAFGELRASEFKGLIDRCELVIGERMHACIAGLSTATPTVSVGYSVKAAGITAQALGPDAAERGLTTPVQDFVAGADTLDRLEAVWHDRAAVAATLRERLPAIRERAASAFELALPAS